MTEPGQIRILTVDDHSLLLEGIAVLINGQPDMQLVGQLQTEAKALCCSDSIGRILR